MQRWYVKQFVDIQDYSFMQKKDIPAGVEIRYNYQDTRNLWWRKVVRLFLIN